MTADTLVPFSSEDALINKATQQTPELVVASQDALIQGLGLLFNIWDKTFSRVAEAPYSASIGGHYRHVLEHFQCVIDGIRPGEINYDARERNPRMETEVTYATIATCDVLRAIKNYTGASLARPCKVVNSTSYGSAQPSVIESNFGHELAYCVGHAIHHYAIIRLICSHLGVEVPSEFGIAPSTLKYRSSIAADRGFFHVSDTDYRRPGTCFGYYCGRLSFRRRSNGHHRDFRCVLSP
jgi:hypothetical protein